MNRRRQSRIHCKDLAITCYLGSIALYIWNAHHGTSECPNKLRVSIDIIAIHPTPKSTHDLPATTGSHGLNLVLLTTPSTNPRTLPSYPFKAYTPQTPSQQA